MAAPLRLQLRVIPRARRTGWDGMRDGRLLVRLQAAPTEGRANVALKKFLAAQFGTPQAAVLMERGQKSREKTVSIQDPTRIPHAIQAYLQHRPGGEASGGEAS